MDAIYTIFTMLGGLAVFMYGMKIMGDSLENLAGDNVRTLFNKVSNSRAKGVAIGAGVTAIIQSSSATTVMLVGFVNVGMLSLLQATAIIMGSNIGTTITAQLSSLSALNVTAVMSCLAFVGLALVMFSKKESKQKLGIIFLGLGMLFIGLSLMSSSMKTFAYDDSGNPSAFAEFMLSSFTNPMLNILLGALFTAVIQSSSAATGILITFASAGVITFDMAIFMVLGTNIGTCITAILASIGASTNAKRTAAIHLMFNIVGTLIVILPTILFTEQIQSLLVAISGVYLERQIANFHTIFNILITIILLPFAKQMVHFAEILIPEKKEEEEKKAQQKLYYLDERILQTPPLACQQVIAEVENMGVIARENLNFSLQMLIDKNNEKREFIVENEKLLNYLNREIANYLVKISALDISARDSQILGSLFHVVSDIERIGDYSENVMDFADRMIEDDMNFSSRAVLEIKDLAKKLDIMFGMAIETFTKRDRGMIDKVQLLEDEVDKIKDLMEDSHIERLNGGNCSVESGAIYLSLASQLERVADHMLNIAKSIIPQEERAKKKLLTLSAE
ncbi:MAG: Na/Pi cotransporter family protein [Bacillota bacterium]